MYEMLGIVLLGLATGVLINYLSNVLPLRRRLARPICSACQQEYSVRAFLLGKHCQSCGKSPSVRFWLVLIFYPLSFILFWTFPIERFDFWFGAPVLAFLGLIFIIDLEYRAILQSTMIFGALLFFGLGTYLHGFISTVAGGLAGFLIMLLLYYFGSRFGRWLAKRRNLELDEPTLGFGDVNLGGVIGLVLGWPGIIAGLFLSIFLGGITGALYLLYAAITRQYRPFFFLPYAPFMVLATVFFLFRP